MNLASFPERYACVWFYRTSLNVFHFQYVCTAIDIAT